MKKTTRLIAFSLAAFCLTVQLFSCGDSGKPTESETGEASSEVTTEAPKEFEPKSLNLGGREFSLYLWRDTLMAVEEEDGDTINDAVFRRNSKVEDLYNLKFKYDVRDCPHNTGGYSEWYNVLSSSILAGDNAYDLAGGYSYQLVTNTLEGQFYNLNANPNIDFSKPWWPSNIMETGNIGGKMFLTYGNIDPLYYDFTYTIYFNKRLAADYKLDDLYGMVRDGSWTLDRVIELSKLAAKDLDGDSAIGDNDQFGYITDWNMSVDAYIQACDIKITDSNSNGMPKLLGLTEKYVDVQKKLEQFFKNSGTVKYGSNSGTAYPEIFMSGKGLFYADKLGRAHMLREMQDDFGILPYPKYDAEQDNYITYNAIGDTTGFCIPVTADENESGAVLEALAYYGWKDVLPEYFERALKGKAARDSESAEMLDIIYGNIQFELTQIYSFCFGNQKAPSMVMRMSMKDNKEISSLWASDENTYEATMKELIDTIK